MSLGLQLGNRLGLGQCGRPINLQYLLNQNFLDPAQYEPGGWLFDNHSRDTGATVVDENGNVVWAPENLLPYSTPTTAGWADIRSVLTGGEDDPFGGNAASLLTEDNTASNSHYCRETLGGESVTQVVTFSVYAKPNGRTQIGLSNNFSGGDTTVVFDLSAVSIVSEGGSVLDSDIIDVGSGWCRCWMRCVSGVVSASDLWDITLADGGAVVYDGDGSSGAYLYGAQLERGNTLTNLKETDGSSVYSPRLQHDSAGNPLGYLHEPQATRINPQAVPASLPQAANAGTVTLTADSGAAPTGTEVATLVEMSGVAYARLFYYAVGQLLGKTITSSIFVKQTATGRFGMGHYMGGGSSIDGDVFVDLSNDSVISQGADIDNVEIEDWANGWKRVIITGGFLASGSDYVRVYPAGYYDGTVRNPDDVMLWHLQVEEGTVATSPILGEGSPVTRQADILDPVTVAAMDQGMMYFEMSIDPNAPRDNSNSLIGRAYLDDDNEVLVITRTARNDKITTLTRSGGTASAPEPDSPIPDGSQFHKIAFTWGATNLLYVDGISYAVADEATNPSGLTNFLIGRHPTLAGSSDNGVECFRAVRLSPRNFSDAELQSLTT